MDSSPAAAHSAENTVGGDLDCYGGRFINPDNLALEAGGDERATFGGKANEHHGLYAVGLSTHMLIWQNVSLENGAIVDLSGANVANLLDDEKSWPAPGKLLIDGFTYQTLVGSSSYAPDLHSPVDARSRLRWLELQDGYHPQPYRQLAKVLRENGDDAGAIDVLVAQQTRAIATRTG